MANPETSRCRTWCYDSNPPSSFHHNTLATRAAQCELTGKHVLSAVNHSSSVWVEDANVCRSGSNSSSVCIGSLHWKSGGHHPCELPVRDTEAACAILARKNVSSVLVVGDSLIRHVFLALHMLLTGWSINELRNGCSMIDAFKQEAGGPCLNAKIKVEAIQQWCGGAVRGKFSDRRHYGGKQGDLPIVAVASGQLVLFGIGVHPVLTDPSRDLNNASMKKLAGSTWTAWAYRSKQLFPVQRDVFLRRPCEKRRHGKRGNGRVLWLPGTFRVMVGRYDDSNERGARFAAESARYLDEECDGVPTLNFIEPTRAAGQLMCRPAECDARVASYETQKSCKLIMRETCEDASSVTFDGYHWGVGVNSLKVQAVLAWLAGPDV